MNDRAHVPFALVGVVLLVTSVTLTATVSVHDAGQPPAVDQAMDGAKADTTTALRRATDEAATEAAANPVTVPANTTAGRALNDSQPFRDALRLRLYLNARARLESVEFRRDGVIVTPTVPPVESTTASYRNAIKRVSIRRAGEDEAAIHVQIANVTLEATRNGRTVAEAEHTPAFVVANPALLLHDRSEAFERRVNAPVTDPGLGRRLTARLYPIAWTRGYAQYGGAPIANVLGTRHLELATNDALLAEQRAVLGQTAPDSERGVAAAGRRVATTDLLVGAGGDEEWTDAVLDAADDVGGDTPPEQPVGTWREEPSDADVTVAVDTTADRAYADVVGLRHDREQTATISRLVDRAHTVEARLDTAVETRVVTRRTDERPGAVWKLVDESTELAVELTESDGTLPTSDGWTTRDGVTYRTSVTETTTRTWKRDTETKTTESVVERDGRVRVALQARTKPIDGVPAGNLDGTLAPATDQAERHAIRKAGGYRNAAKSAVVGNGPAGTSAVTAEPTVSRDKIETVLQSLRDRTREVTVTVPAPAVGAGRTNPPAQLRTMLADRQDEFLDFRERSASKRTIHAVKVAYLDELDDHLETRADSHAAASDGIGSAVDERLGAEQLDGALASHRPTTQPTPARPTDPAGNLTLSVDTAPAYLTTGAVTRDRMDVRGGGSTHPLSTRNVNVFTSPHKQVATSIVDRIPYLGGERVALRTAAVTLAAADEAPDSERRALKREVKSATNYVRGELVATMVAEGVPEHVARETVRTDSSTPEEALDVANGSAIERSIEGVDDVDRERLRLRLETTLEETLQDRRARPRRRPTTETADAAREAYHDDLEAVIGDGVESKAEQARKRAIGERMGSIPAGIPIMPVPGYWYATANVWYVAVGGTYERFTVRTNRGGPGGTTTYLRDGRRVRLHHGGEKLQLGHSGQISFRTETAVVVVVPPGGSGVGDTDGVSDERSPGWPP